MIFFQQFRIGNTAHVVLKLQPVSGQPALDDAVCAADQLIRSQLAELPFDCRRPLFHGLRKIPSLRGTGEDRFHRPVKTWLITPVDPVCPVFQCHVWIVIIADQQFLRCQFAARFQTESARRTGRCKICNGPVFTFDIMGNIHAIHSGVRDLQRMTAGLLRQQAERSAADFFIDRKIFHRNTPGPPAEKAHIRLVVTQFKGICFSVQHIPNADTDHGGAFVFQCRTDHKTGFRLPHIPNPADTMCRAIVCGDKSAVQFDSSCQFFHGKEICVVCRER